MSEVVGGRVEVPILETPRLVLRGHRPDDLGSSAALWGDLEVVRYIGGRVLSQEEVWARVLRYAGHWAWMHYGVWVVEEKATGQFVGEVGYGNHKRDIQPGFEGVPELGWVLARQFHGRGYAYEAVRAAMDWGAQNLSSRRTVCIIDPEHERSVRLAEKCGFREWQRTSYRAEPILVFLHEVGEGK